MTTATSSRDIDQDGRWPLWTAIAFSVLFLVAAFVVPPVPGIGSSGAKVAAHYRDHGGAVRLSAWLVGLSAVPYVVYVCWLRSVLRGIGRDVALFGGITIGILTTVYLWVLVGPALHPGALDPATARTIADVAAIYGPSLAPAVVLLAGPVALDALRPGGAFAPWVAWVSIALVVEQALETLTMFPDRGFFAPGGGLNMLIGPLLFLAWSIATAAGYRRTPRSA